MVEVNRKKNYNELPVNNGIHGKSKNERMRNDVLNCIIYKIWNGNA